jgi:SAM-dependent methyltransferase
MSDPMEPEIGDAFGMALIACHEAGGEPGHVPEIIERDDGLIDVGEPARYFLPPEGDAAGWVLQRTRGRVLDIGAGAGRYSLAAQDRDCEVVALDVSEGALQVCRARGVGETFLGTVVDLASREPEPFDTFLLMGNNLGLLGAPDAAVDFLAALDDLAAEGAHIIAEGNDAALTDDPEHLRYHELNRDRGRHPHVLHLRSRFARYASDWFDYLMPSPDELVEILDATAWTVEALEHLPGIGPRNYFVDLRRR